jgi:hypothetical protein
MLVAAVEQQDGAFARLRDRRPMAVEQRDAVVGLERLFLDRAHERA